MAKREYKHPEPFLEVRVKRMNIKPTATGLCAGYELDEWRCDQLAGHLIKWLPEFALTFSERVALGDHNAAELLARAARTVYTSRKYKRRGEVGELLLHIAIRQVFKTTPAIAKYFFKDSANDTVKGFDAVHVVASDSTLELWLGEVKLYTNVQRAIKSIIKDLRVHSKRNYLKAEFAMIMNKIDPQWPFAERLTRLLHPNTSLDDVFDRVAIPALVAYDSKTIADHTRVSEEFKAAFIAEVRAHWEYFTAHKLPKRLRVHLIFVPLCSKQDVLKRFDERLRHCQSIV